MKKNYILGFLFLSSGIIAGNAQDEIFWGDVPVIGDSYGHKITRDGTFSTGEAVMVQSGWGRDNITGETFFYEGCTVGYGNPISKDHAVVGNDAGTMQAAFLIGGEDPKLIGPMAAHTESYAHGITWDGTRVCGFVYNENFKGFDIVDPNVMNSMYVPVVCDIDPATGEAYNLQYLKYPLKDFFGLAPQYCTAIWISDDGKTVIGQIVDNTGFFVYPVVYFQDENGEWDYKLPSESLFNPDGLPIPQYPELLMDAPQAIDYVIPEKRKLFEEMADNWSYQNGGPDPYDLLNPKTAGEDAFMTQEGYDAFMKALTDFAQYSIEYNELLNEYYTDLTVFMSHSISFHQSSMAMNNDGTLMAQMGIVNELAPDMTLIRHTVPYLFNLEDGTYEIVNDGKNAQQILQILPDKTLICSSRFNGAGVVDKTFVLPPGGDSYIPLQDYIKPQNPDVYEWYEEYLAKDVVTEDVDGDLLFVPQIVTGLVAVSDDFTAMSGGVDAWSWDLESGDYYTYFITGMTTPDPAGIESITNEFPNDDTYRVFNLQGSKLMETKDIERVKSLEKGIYIINGKKVML